MTLGEIIRNARKEKGYTQKELAKIIGVKNGALSNWEINKNRPNSSTLIMLFRVLDINIKDLIGDSNYDINELDKLNNQIDGLTDKEYITLMSVNENLKGFGADVSEAMLNQFIIKIDSFFDDIKESPFNSNKYSDMTSLGKIFANVIMQSYRLGIHYGMDDTFFKILVSFSHFFDTIKEANKKYTSVHDKENKSNFIKVEIMRLSNYIKDDVQDFFEYCYETLEEDYTNNKTGG